MKVSDSDTCIMFGVKIDLRKVDDVNDLDELFWRSKPGEAELIIPYSIAGSDFPYGLLGVGIQGFDNFYPDEIDIRELLKWIDPVDADRLGGDPIRRAIEKIKEAGLGKSIVFETPKLLLFMHNDD